MTITKATHVETKWRREADCPLPSLSITYDRLREGPYITGTNTPVTDEVYRAYGYVKVRRTVTEWERCDDESD